MIRSGREIVCVRKHGEKLLINTFTNGMTKQEVDIWVSNNYDYLNRVASIVCAKYNREYDPAEIYVRILPIAKKLQKDEDLLRYITTMINREGAGENSNVNYSYKKRHDSLIGIEAQDESEVDFEREIDFNHKKAVLISYRNNLKCSIKKTVYDVYFEKGYRTCEGIGDYFNLNKMTGMKIIQELKQDIRNYEKIQSRVSERKSDN